MKWQPAIDKEGIAQPAIESDCRVWRISKAQLSPGLYRYALHKHGGEALQFAADSETLKQAAEKLTKGK